MGQRINQKGNKINLEKNENGNTMGQTCKTKQKEVWEGSFNDKSHIAKTKQEKSQINNLTSQHPKGLEEEQSPKLAEGRKYR